MYLQNNPIQYLPIWQTFTKRCAETRSHCALLQTSRLNNIKFTITRKWTYVDNRYFLMKTFKFIDFYGILLCLTYI